MVIPHRQRAPPASHSANSTPNSQNDSHWLNTSRASRPWDSHHPRLKPATPKVPFSVSDRKAVFQSESHSHSISLSRDSNPLNSFLPSAQPPLLPHHHQPPSLLPPSSTATRLGNRVVDPVDFQSSVAPRLVGLLVPVPTPSPMHLSHDSQGSSEPSSLKDDYASLQSPTPPASHPPAPPPSAPPLPPLPEFGPNPLPLQHLPTLSRRYSVRQSRHSIRVPASALNTALGNEANAAKEQVPGPVTTQLDLLPDSSSFLDFNDDARLNPNPIPGAEPQSSASAVVGAAEPTSFDDADSFDTFASLAQHGHGHDPDHERETGHGLDPLHESFSAPTPPLETTQDKSGFLSPSFAETPRKTAAGEDNDGIDCTNLHIHTFSLRPADNVEVSTTSTTKNTNDDEDGRLDIPARVSASPAANRAMRELQRASITAANELAQSIRLMSSSKGDGQENKTTTKEINITNNNNNPRRQSMQQKLQGQVMLRSRIFRRWNMRYATIINQAYFGAVLLLFKPDAKPLFASSLSLKRSKMIALNHSTVAVVDEPKKYNNGLVYTFSITTSQRTYTFACNDEKTRNMWVSNLSAPPV